MANTEQPERGIQKPYDARYGITVGGCRGLYIAHDSSVLEDEQLYNAINVRVQDGIVISRFGQSAPTNQDPMEGCVQGLVDIENAGPRFILATNRGDTIANASDIDMLAAQATTPYVRVTDQPNNLNPLSGQPTKGQINLNALDVTRPRYVLGFWDGAVIFAGANYDAGGALDTAHFKIFKILLPDDAVSAQSIQAEPLFDCVVPGELTQFEPTSMVVLPAIAVDIGVREPIYFGTLGGGVVAYVNGEMVRLQPEGTFAGRVIVFQYNNRLYAAGQHELRVQDGWVTGGSPVSTSWTNVALPVGPTVFEPMCALEWNGFGWIGGYDSTATGGWILKVDDSTGTPIVTVGFDGSASYISFDDFAVGLGGFYVGDRFDTGTTQQGQLESFDGTTLTQLAIWTEDGAVPRLVGHRSAIYVSAWATGNAPGGGQSAAIWEWDGSAISKIADVVDADPEGSPFDMVLF